MTVPELDNLAKTGILKPEQAAQDEFYGLVASGSARLADASNDTLALESRFDLAYNAAHALSLAALRWHGYRPDFRRYIVFQTLPHTLGLDARVWRVLDRAHSLRNLSEYQGILDVTEQLVADILAAAKEVKAKVAALGPVPTVSSKP